ncbi:putative phage tail length tape measure protein [Neisseria flavescens]|uniref:Prophage tail length tape measure protein n=1 Tax=Neisseria flavescens NRL30031/H210 TaxID=546264 RepID=C0EP45_NEIFL|nr:phage tail length tape measure family protein [Neisseria flavescens]EEG33169.1 prophage tail length tape measure protein [Neisseria flavescens NRL30031/H210]SPY03851.1 putative phage tail length tape measure protein [Neisseria meningitidis]STZ62691.1 putative phage tail length tape measure protein [Neisseria flavescens]
MAENTIKAGLDVSDIESGAKKAGVALRSIGKAAKDAGQQSAAGAAATAAGYDKAGKEAERLTKKQERATQSIINAVQREIAVREAGGRGTAAYYELLARQRGADVAKISEITQALKRQENQLKLNNISVGQYNNAMRMVPAQFTDIFTQLAGGQNPFLIALQQGGQLRDSFGGFGNMFKGLAASINPATVALGGLVAGLGAVGKAYYDGSEESQRFSAAVILAGGSAGASAGKLMSIADSVGRATGSWSDAREAILLFVQSGAVASENYGRFAESVVLQSKATGKSVEDLARVYEEIADDPLKAVVKFSRVYQTLNADVYEQARALIEQGRQQEAVALIQGKFADESQQMSERVLENLGAIERGWNAVKKAASEAWEDMKSIGREATLESRLAEKRLFLQQIPENPYTQPQVDAAKREIDLLEKQIKMRDEAQKQAAFIRKEQADSVSAAANFDRLRDQTQSKAEKFAREERQWQEKLNALKKHGSNQQIADAEKVLARLRQQHKEELAADAARAAKKRGAVDKNLFPTTSAGLRLKPGAEAGGRAFGGTYAAMHAMQQFLGDKLVRFGAVNDKYHIGKNSFHNKGLAFDMTPNLSLKSEDKAKVARQIRQYFESLGFKDGKDFNVKFEVGGQVNKNGTKATADHWHFNWRSQAAAARFAGGVDGQAKAMARSGLFAEARERKPELTGYQKWEQEFGKRQLAASAELSLSAANLNKTYAEQLRLLSDPTFKKWSAAERKSAMDLAIKADNQADLTKEAKKYADALRELEAAGQRDFDDQLFELSLLGKTREEVERLTAARKYDKLIAEAIASGASADVIKSLQTAKLDNDGRLQERLRLEKETKDAFDNNWLAGISAGMRNYSDSFKSMRENMSDAVTGSLGKMSDALADFVATGKADFRSLAVSILQDLSKMLIKMALFNAMKAAMSAWGGGGLKDGGMVQQFSNGGAVWGAGTATSDSIPALLSNGEFVINAASTRRHRALLEAINQNRYASGGAVGVAPQVAALGGGAGGMTVNITINRDGSSDSSVDGDVEMAKQLGAALPAMIENWFVNNVVRVGGRYHGSR